MPPSSERYIDILFRRIMWILSLSLSLSLSLFFLSALLLLYYLSPSFEVSSYISLSISHGLFASLMLSSSFMKHFSILFHSFYVLFLSSPLLVSLFLRHFSSNSMNIGTFLRRTRNFVIFYLFIFSMFLFLSCKQPNEKS